MLRIVYFNKLFALKLIPFLIIIFVSSTILSSFSLLLFIITVTSFSFLLFVYSFISVLLPKVSSLAAKEIVELRITQPTSPSLVLPWLLFGLCSFGVVTKEQASLETPPPTYYTDIGGGVGVVG